MMTLALAPMVVSVLVAIFLFACVVLILTVLIQRPQGGGLSGAFGAGGGGAGQTAFGTKTGDALTYATIGLFILFLGLAIGLNFVTRPTSITPTQAALIPDPDADASVTTTTVGDDDAEPDAVDLIVNPDDDASAEESAGDTVSDDDATEETSTDEQATEPATDPETNPASEPGNG